MRTGSKLALFFRPGVRTHDAKPEVEGANPNAETCRLMRASVISRVSELGDPTAIELSK